MKQNELIERDPFLGSHYTFGAEFKNHGWLTSPSLYIKELANHFKNNGGKIIKKQVKEIYKNTVITQDNEILEADKIVICAGAWSGQLLKSMKLRTNLETE